MEQLSEPHPKWCKDVFNYSNEKMIESRFISWVVCIENSVCTIYSLCVTFTLGCI